MNKTYREVEKQYEDLNKAKLYWEIGKGLQAVDYLHTSKKLDDLIEQHLAGKKDYSQVESEIKQYHKEYGNTTTREDEADIVATRIAKLLNSTDFRLTKLELLRTHKYIFEGLFDDDIKLRGCEGRFRTVNLEKSEDVLNGKSVVYTDYKNIEEYLDYDLEEERNRIRTEEIDNIKHLSKFVSNIWNTHPFREGNTRTTAVFVVRYLKANRKFVTSDLFKENSLYFRNALVLSSDNQSDIPSTLEYVESFFDKLLKNPKAKLKETK